jgi:hypothetical protein
MMGFLSRVGQGAIKTLGSLREPVRKLGQIGYNVGKFAVQNHQHIAPILHGVAMASGNQTAQKITGGLLALSGMAKTRQNLNAQNEKIRAEQGRGGYGTYNASTGTMSGYR